MRWVSLHFGVLTGVQGDDEHIELLDVATGRVRLVSFPRLESHVSSLHDCIDGRGPLRCSVVAHLFCGWLRFHLRRASVPLLRFGC